MKRMLLAVLLAVAFPAAASATAPLWNSTMGTWTKLKASVHDFTGSNPYASYQSLATNLCQSCHAPHEAPGAAYGPLWNHALNTNGFTMYSPLSGSTPPSGQPGSASLRCLGCHDGRLNVDAYGGKTGTIKIKELASTKSNVGTNLTDDHPVGFDIPVGGAGTGWQTTIGGTAKTYAGGGARGENVECASCHDPHGVSNYGYRFLRGADFCTDCHNK